MRMLAAVALVSILFASPAHAQSGAFIANVLGQEASNMNANHAGEQCLLGPTSFSDRAMASARDGVMRTMTSYLTSASASSSADVSGSFSGAHRQQIWVADDVSGNVRSVSDPLAQRFTADGAVVLPSPDAFVRSGDEETAEALWILRDPSDATRVVGSYLARFRRETFRGWVLTRLHISTRAETPEAPTSYCHEDGDIAPPKPKLSESAAASDAESTGAQRPAPQSSGASTPQ